MNPKNQRFSGVASDCYDCLLKQAQAAAEFAELDTQQTRRILDVARHELDKVDTRPRMPQHIVRAVTDAIVKEKGLARDFDIYGTVKEYSNAIAQKYMKQFRTKIEQSESPLETGLQIAAAGNIIDFGARDRHNLDVDAEMEKLEQTRFARFDIDALKERLQGADMLLYLCDNCGEIVLDMLFMETLQVLYPKLRITAATRHTPIINDATVDDARQIGLDTRVHVMSSGSVYPGTILNETSLEFQEQYNSADVILSKGQGNYETLCMEKDPRLFFLLKIKCDVMAHIAGEENGKLVLINNGI